MTEHVCRDTVSTHNGAPMAVDCEHGFSASVVEFELIAGSGRWTAICADCAAKFMRAGLGAKTYEATNRRIKVSLLVAATPNGDSAAANARAAETMAEWSQDDRDRFAASVGCRSPSAETWRQVVAAVRGRMPKLRVVGVNEAIGVRT